MTQHLTKVAPLLLMIGLQACGGGGGGDGDGDDKTAGTPVTETPDLVSDTRNHAILLTGVLVDAGPVAGLAYTTASQTGTTNDAGQFDYADGEDIQFSLGGQNLGNRVPAGSAVLTTSLSGANEETPDPFVNLTRLLQTLDTDGNPANGITITEAADTAVVDNGLTLDINQSSMEFEMDTDVLTLISNGGQNTPPSQLVDADQAVASTLTNITGSYFVGAWDIDVPVELDTDQTSLQTFLILLKNNTFVFANIDEKDFTADDDEPCGKLGVEWGSYTVAQARIELTVEFDTNGCKGLFDDSDGDGPGTTFILPIVATEDNAFTVEVTDDNDDNPVNVELTRADNSASDLVGLWQEEDREALLQFFPNGVFYFVEDPAVSDNGQPFIELFRYRYDTNAATIHAEVLAGSSTNADSVTSGETFSLTNISVDADQLNFREGGEQARPHKRITPY